MRTRTVSFILILSLTAFGAVAQNNRSFVSTSGSDANDCTAGHECRSFSRAIAVTNPGGEIIAVTSGGYGAFVISSSISVMAAPGVAAGITSSSGIGIYINTASTDRVAIRGLNITILANAAAIGEWSWGTLSIENCTVTGGGLSVAGGYSSSHAIIVDTVVRNVSTNAFYITSRATLLRCRAEENGGDGLYVGTHGIVTAVDFTSVHNAIGVYVESSPETSSAVNLDRAVISHNTYDGVVSQDSGGGAFVRVTNSTVTENIGAGFHQQGAAYFGSMNNNMLGGNFGGDTVGTISPITAH